MTVEELKNKVLQDVPITQAEAKLAGYTAG